MTLGTEFPVRSNTVTLYVWRAKELGEGCVKITLIVSCLEWLTCLEFELLYSPDSKMVLIFLVTKVFQNGTMFNEFMFNSRI